MTIRSNRIAKRWFLIVGLAVAAFIVLVVAVMLWPRNGPIAAVNAAAEADVIEAEVREEGWYTAAQALVGEEAYAQSCARCHGDDLEGGVGTAMEGDVFWRRWGGQSVHALFEITRQTMPQEDPGSLTDQRYADIIAYVLHVNGFPPGETELPLDADSLQALTIERGVIERGENDTD